MPGTVTQRKASADAIAERLRDIIFQVGSSLKWPNDPELRIEHSEPTLRVEK